MLAVDIASGPCVDAWGSPPPPIETVSPVASKASTVFLGGLPVSGQAEILGAAPYFGKGAIHSIVRQRVEHRGGVTSVCHALARMYYLHFKRHRGHINVAFYW